jgi:hypothetical protein
MTLNAFLGDGCPHTLRCLGGGARHVTYRVIRFDAMVRLGPTSPDLLRDDTRPYFLFWTDATVADFRAHLASSDLEERAYWMGALLREANTRDVWLFVTSDEIRELWPKLVRYLGRARSMWAYLLQLPEPTWPPDEDKRA